jgi:hypothetical protein
MQRSDEVGASDEKNEEKVGDGASYSIPTGTLDSVETLPHAVCMSCTTQHAPSN